MKKGVVALLIFAAIPFFFVDAYTSPGKPMGYVNDFGGILSQEEKVSLEATLVALEKDTDSEVVVVTIPTLGDEVIETYAVELFEEWNIGKKGKDNGLLLLIALNEKQMRIEVGYGLEGDIVDAQASRIIRTMLAPAFKEGNYGEGIEHAIAVISELIKKNPNALPGEDPPTSSGSVQTNWFYLIIFIPMWLASILGRSKSWWAGGVIGVIAGVVVGFISGFIFTGIISIVIFAIVGLIFDFIVSKQYHSSVDHHTNPPWWIGGGRGGGRGGFGGFGGGRSGGGGASGGW